LRISLLTLRLNVSGALLGIITVVFAKNTYLKKTIVSPRDLELPGV